MDTVQDFEDLLALLEEHGVRYLIIGGLLVLGGVAGFLPVLGFWMIPLGLLVLSYDLPLVRRWRRRLEVAWGRRRRRDKGRPSN